MEDDRVERVLRGLDAQQRVAATIDAAPLAVIAAAGSGKTRVLTARVAHRALTGSAAAQHTLVLTFTRDAAGELRRRLRRLDLRTPVEAGTFHSVALRLLRDRAFARNEAAPTVATDRLRLAREAVTELRLGIDASAALGELDWARARLVPPGGYADAVRAERRRSALPPERFADLHQRYTDVKRARGVVDFDDLLERCLHALQQDETFAAAVRWRFRHFFVDEAQDLNPLQFRLLEAWRAGRPDLCLVGDPRQAIYGWNGADPTLLADVERTIAGVTVVRLTGNYRSTEPVLDVGRAVLGAAAMDDDSESRLGSGHPVEVLGFDDDQAEAAAVADLASTRLRAGAPSVAVLARTNEQLAPVVRLLEGSGTAVRLAGRRRPVDLVVAEAVRCANREQLAAWAEQHAASDDAVRRRVAEEADRFLSSGEAGGLRAWLERTDALADLEIDDHLPAVEVATFHAAKGREWDTVVVTGVEQRLVPHASAATPAARSEEARLLYVALTRATNRLTVTHSRARGGKVSGASPWWPTIEAAAAQGPAVAPPADLPRAAPDVYAAIREWRHAIARVAGVDDRAVCSDRVMRSLVDDPPADPDELARRLGISPAAARRLRPLPPNDPAPDARTPRAASR